MEPPTVREITKRLEQEGWELVSIRGDHRKYRKGGLTVIVPGKMGKPMKKGTYESVKRQAGW